MTGRRVIGVIVVVLVYQGGIGENRVVGGHFQAAPAHDGAGWRAAPGFHQANGWPECRCRTCRRWRSQWCRGCLAFVAAIISRGRSS